MENLQLLLISALNSAMKEAQQHIPKTKIVAKTASILDVKPTELAKFMDENNIPETAVFSGTDNGYDAWDDVVLEWEAEAEMTSKDVQSYLVKKFEDVAWRNVYKVFTENGFARQGVNSSDLSRFPAPYYMYVEGEFDRLIEFYSLRFKSPV